jgi:carbon monoxide dehydrogenase subunit G
MKMTTFAIGLLVSLTIYGTACKNIGNQQTKSESNMEKQETHAAIPAAEKWVKSQLRNRIKLELDAPINEVWALLGDPAKMPIYSSGLNKVDTKTDGSGKCTQYTCYFKPMEQGGQETVHSAKMLWHEPKKGWASLDEEPNAFGLQQSLTLITLEQRDSKTILNWSMHFNCESQEMLQLNISSLEQALNGEIVQQLIDKFGGKVIESFVEG